MLLTLRKLQRHYCEPVNIVKLSVFNDFAWYVIITCYILYSCRGACLKVSCDYLFTVDSLAMLTQSHTIQHLIEVNRSDLHLHNHTHSNTYTITHTQTPYRGQQVRPPPTQSHTLKHLIEVNRSDLHIHTHTQTPYRGQQVRPPPTHAGTLTQIHTLAQNSCWNCVSS